MLISYEMDWCRKEKIARLNKQIHELTELNRKCDRHKKRQLHFLQTLINSFKGDNVPLSDSVCIQECKKHNVKSKLCNLLCATSATHNDNYRPCDQNWKKQFNRRMRKYDKENIGTYRSNKKASEMETSIQSRLWDKETFLTLASLLDDTGSDIIRTPRSSHKTRRELGLGRHRRSYYDENNYSYLPNKEPYTFRNPYSYEFDYSDTDEPTNVILSSKEDTDRIIFNRNHHYAKEIDWETPLPHEPKYVIPDPLGPIDQTLPTDGLNVTVPILGELKLRDEKLLRQKPVNTIMCRQLTCVTNSGFKATVCFLAYDPDTYFSETIGISNSTFGKQIALCTTLILISEFLPSLTLMQYGTMHILKH